MKTEIRCKVECREDDTLQFSRGGWSGRYSLTTSGRLIGRNCSRGARLTWTRSGRAGGIVINRQHTRGAPIVRVVPELRGDQLVIDTALPDTQAGRDAAGSRFGRA